MLVAELDERIGLVCIPAQPGELGGEHLPRLPAADHRAQGLVAGAGGDQAALDILQQLVAAQALELVALVLQGGQLLAGGCRNSQVADPHRS